MLRQQAEKALLQLGEFQSVRIDAAAATEGPPLSGVSAGATDDATQADPPKAASPDTNPPVASAPEAPLAEHPFWALPESDVVDVTAASAPDDAAEPGVSVSERTPFERARSDLLAAAQRAEQAQRADGGAAWEQAQAELLRAAAAVVANAGALTGPSPHGNPHFAAGSVWPYNHGPAGHELPPQWSMQGGNVHALPPWAAPLGGAPWGDMSPWGYHPSSWPDAARMHALQMQWPAASAAQPLQPQTSAAPRAAARPATGPPPESSYASGHAGSFAMVDDGMSTPGASSAGDVDGRTVAGRAHRMASTGDASPRLFSPCAYSPSTFDEPAPLLAVGPGPEFDSAPSPMHAEARHGGAPFADDSSTVAGIAAADEQPSGSTDAPATENVAASRPNFATRSKGGGFFNKSNTGAVQVSVLASNTPCPILSHACTA